MRDVVRRQTDTGLDVVGDGEFGKPTDTTNDADHGHGVWALYVRERLTGFEWVEGEKASPSSKDRTAFPAFYGTGGRRQPAEGGRAGEVGTTTQVFTCTGPIAYCGSRSSSRATSRICRPRSTARTAAGAFLPGGLPRVAAVAHPRPPPRRRGRLPTGARRRAARGVPRDRRGRPDAADRRPGARRRLGLLARRRPRRLPRRRPARRRAAQRGAARDPDRADPLPPLLGQLAGPAPLRPAARRRRRPHARDPRRRVPRRGRQRAARARVEALARHRAARRRDAHPRRRLRTRRASWSTPRSSPTGSCATRTSSGPSASWPGPTAALGGRISSDVAWAKLDDARGGRATGERPTGDPMTDRILTTHTGSLPRPPGLVEALGLAGDGAADDATQERMLQEAVAGVVARQVDAGVDVVSDGEQSKAGYSTYVTRAPHRLRRPRHPLRAQQDAIDFPEWGEPLMAGIEATLATPACIGDVAYAAPALVERDIENLRRRARRPPGRGGLHDHRVARRHQPVPREPALRRATRTTSARSPRRCAPSTRRCTRPGFLLQIDCPDLAVGRHVQFPDHAARGVQAHDRAARRGAQRRDPRHPAGGDAHPPLLGQLRGAAQPRRPARGDPADRPARAARADLLRARQPAARARVARLRGRRPARRQGPRPRRHRLDDELHRAPGPRRRAHRPARAARRARARHREHGLRLRDVRRVRARVPVDRLREARRPRGGRRARERGALARPGRAWRRRRAPRAARRP